MAPNELVCREVHLLVAGVEAVVRHAPRSADRDQLELRVVDQQRGRRVRGRRAVRDVAAERAAVLRRDAAGLGRRPRQQRKLRTEDRVREHLRVGRERAERHRAAGHLDAAELRQSPQADVPAAGQRPGFEQHHQIGASGKRPAARVLREHLEDGRADFPAPGDRTRADSPHLLFTLRRRRSALAGRRVAVAAAARAPPRRCACIRCTGRDSRRALHAPPVRPDWASARAASPPRGSSPGVQMPHCAPPYAMKASCTACRRSPSATPSIVTMTDPSACSERHEAAVHEPAVERDRARAAFPFAASFLRSRQVQPGAQGVEQPRHRMPVQGRVGPVDAASDRNRRVRHRHPPSAPSVSRA